MTGNGWDQHKIDVNRRLDGHDEDIKELGAKLDELRQAPGRMAIALLAIILGAASSGLTTWLTRQPATAQVWSDEDRATINAIRQLLERQQLRNDAKETHR